MTRKEVLTIIAANPNRELFVRYGGSQVQMHEPASKTRILKHAAHIKEVRVQTMLQERPDLARYLDRPGSRQSLQLDSTIVTFDLTS